MNTDNSTANSDEVVAPQPVYDDIQGLMVNGYRGYNFIRFLIFTIPEANIQAVRKFCGALIPGTAGSPLTISAATRWLSREITKPPYRLNLGVTQTGLKKLITQPNYTTVYNRSYQLMNRFELGAADTNTAERVGDTGPSDPANWWQSAGWLLPKEDRGKTDLDLVISLYAPTADERDEWSDRLMKMIGPDSAVLAFKQDSDPLDPAGQKIHFGYRDGISQPRIAGFSETDPELDDRPTVAAWHFMIEATQKNSPSSGIHASAPPPNYTAHPLLKNGSFGAFRLLYQNVKSFEDFINQNGPDQAEHIASKMAGRWRDGTPVEVSPDKPENQHLLDQSLLDQYHLNNFDYVTTSPHQEPKPAPRGNPDIGQACPYAAHVRRSNPRDDGSVIGNSDLASSHRVLRRARPYGPPYNPKDPASADQDRGLVGLFIGADLSAQFEFLMNSWITNGHFSTNDNSPNSSGYDPLFGAPPDAVPPGAVPPNTTEFSYCTGDPSHPSDYETLQLIRQRSNTLLA